MRPYDDLVAEALAADVDGWGFGFLDGRATEERPPWGYARLLAGELGRVDAALDLDTGGGEVVDEAPVLPRRMAATEGWPPNLARARARLGARGVEVVHAEPGRPLPFADASFALVSSRHPVAPDWAEIRRVLEPGGTYLGQHVGRESAFELIERFVEPTPEQRAGRDPQREADDARAAGLEVDDLLTARLRMTFADVGAVVWILRKCVWWVPGFDVLRDDAALRAIDEELRGGRELVAHATRHLLRARRPLDA